MKIRKRDGRLAEWNRTKISTAISKAYSACGVPENGVASVVAERVSIELQGSEVADIEDVQNRVEANLMVIAPDVARAYVIYRNERAKGRELKPVLGELSRYVHATKYARGDEDWNATVGRVEDMHLRRFPNLGQRIHDAFEAVRRKEILPSMRSLQFGGEAIEKNNARMFNCAFTLTNRPRAFAEIFYLLLAGCGVGFSVQRRHVFQLPKVKKFTSKVVHLRVRDTIEGWAEAVDWLFNCAFQDGSWPEFGYEDVRDEGAPLKVSGGLAPGHLPLRRAIEICRSMLSHAQGRELRPIEVHDLICHLADAVRSGGIRRSSLISLFDPTDSEMMSCKDEGNFKWGAINQHRANANNSAIALRSSEVDVASIVRKTTYGGEPGLLFVDDLDTGVNPCGEIGLDPADGFGFCNLVEINGSKGDLYESSRRAAFVATLQASYTNFPYLASKGSAERDALIGVSITGICDRPDVCLNQRSLREAAEAVRLTNTEISGEIGVNLAARCTTVKPSGTTSLVLETSSGVHPHHAKRYLRRVTANRLEPAAREFALANPAAVELRPNGDLSLLFPVVTDGLTSKELSAADQLANFLTLKTSWVDPGHRRGPRNNVSCTLTLEESEMDFVTEWIGRHRAVVGGLSFMLRGNDRMPGAPLQEVRGPADEALWRAIVAGWKRVPYQASEVWGSACEGTKCETR